jgi:hypothetical protein
LTAYDFITLDRGISSPAVQKSTHEAKSRAFVC